MTAWLRLWEFTTVLWGLVVLVVFAIAVSGRPDAEGPSFHVKLSEKARPYYEYDALLAAGDPPRFAETVTFASGERRTLTFSYPDSISSGDPNEDRAKLARFAEREGHGIDAGEVARFMGALTRRRQDAREARQEYLEIVTAERERLTIDRWRLWIFAPVTIMVPSLLILALGYGVAWLRAGLASRLA